MSTSNIPPVSSNPAKPSGNGQVVQIVSRPDTLRNNARAIRLEGEVTQQNKDGSVRIRTPEGDIDITIRGRQPQVGQKLEVDIPPGNPPRQANIRPAPAHPPSTTPPPTTEQPEVPLPQTPVTKPVQPSQGQPVPTKDGTQQPSARSITQSPSDDYKPSTPVNAAKPVQPRPPLTPGQTVTLVSTTATPALQTPSVMAKVETQVAMVAQKSNGNLITTLLQAVKSALPASANNILAQPLTHETVKASSMPQALTLTAKVISLTLPSGQVITAPSAPTLNPAASAQTPITIPGMAITPSAPAPIVVTVTQLTPQNQPVLPIPMNDKGAVQNFVMQSPPANIPIGTQVTLQPQTFQITSQINQQQAAPMNQPALTTPQNISAPPLLGTPQISMPSVSTLPPAWRSLLPTLQPLTIWPVMDEIFQTFYQATPQAAQILGRTIPSPSNPGNFGPALMLFAAAMKSGDLQTWMGERKLDMIQKLGKGSLMSRLSGEASNLAGNTETAPTDWKSFPIPLLWQNEISKIMFHVRKEPSENERENGEGGTRFIMDLSLTRMGDVQLDGMVRGKQLDLIVRTQTPVSAHMQEAMRIAYAKSLDGTDIFGDIGFQSDRTNWENILKQEERLAASV